MLLFVDTVAAEEVEVSMEDVAEEDVEWEVYELEKGNSKELV